MNKKVTMKRMLALTNEEVMSTLGGYAPPEGWWDDVLNPPSEPKPIDPKDLICW